MYSLFVASTWFVACTPVSRFTRLVCGLHSPVGVLRSLFVGCTPLFEGCTLFFLRGKDEKEGNISPGRKHNAQHHAEGKPKRASHTTSVVEGVGPSARVPPLRSKSNIANALPLLRSKRIIANARAELQASREPPPACSGTQHLRLIPSLC